MEASFRGPLSSLRTGEAAAITFYMTVAMVLNASFVLWQVKARPPDWFRWLGGCLHLFTYKTITISIIQTIMAMI